jgi:addiction module RelE/StbE family toxin
MPMVRITYTNDFLRTAGKLPHEIQDKLASQTELLEKNPFHPVLHTKPLTGQLTGLYSFRITRDWRVIFCFLDPTTLKLINAAHRRDIYK